MTLLTLIHYQRPFIEVVQNRVWDFFFSHKTYMLFWRYTKWSLWLHFVESCHINNLPFSMMNVSMTESKWALPAIDPHCLHLLCTWGCDIGSNPGKFFLFVSTILYTYLVLYLSWSVNAFLYGLESPKAQ